MLDQKIINLYDEYTHKPLTRQEFLHRLAGLVGSISAAMSIIPLLESDYKSGLSTGGDDLFTEYIHYPGVNGEMKAYVARPLENTKYAAVIVIHENRGLTPHIEDVARRAARAGYLAIAPNALAPIGEVANEDEARQKFTSLKADDNLENFKRVFGYLETRSDFNGSVGCVGFCWGGAMAGNLATQVESLKASVSFYGRQPDLASVPKIKSALQLHYAENDERVNAGITDYENALSENNIRFEKYLYEGTQHAFHNDTSVARYNEAAATLAWSRTIDFFEKYL
ncbi:MAG: dienelactone hydrolase family protein [Saprospiraceae bacterium]|nr:dienelactone hydrolase family protein [Saprospiraceae bacterium]